MKKYKEELRDPQWQKKRLEIMDRDNFTCRICGCGITDGKPLNVHHISYKPDLKPWEYPNDMLVTLCEDCHSEIHKKHGKILKKDVEPFFFTYNEFMPLLFKCGVFNTTTKVFYKLMELAEYNTGKVRISPDTIKEVLLVCGISRASYQRAINDLVKEGVVSKSGNIIIIAENMFWKGDRKTRDKLLKNKKK